MRNSRILKDIIKTIPWLARALNYVVRVSRFLLERVFEYRVIQVESNTSIQIIRIPEYKNIFCGYYDVSPFRPSLNNFILLHATNHSAYSSPSTNKFIDLLLYDISSSNWRIIGTTSAWNWQQGARLQWLDNDHVAYNVVIGKKVICKVVNVETGHELIEPVSLSITYGNQYIISIDYCALTHGSEYGYRGLECGSKDSGIYLFRRIDAVVTKLFTWESLLYLSRPGATRIHINHILPSPRYSRLVFIFRYWIKNKRYDSLIQFDLNTCDLMCAIENQVVSHYCWQNEDRLLVWAVIENVPGYYSLDFNSNNLELAVSIDDGHPSWLGDRKCITDYCSGHRFRGKKLTASIMDIKSKSLEPLVTISHPTIFNAANRCDMHISLSGDKRFYQIDSRHIHNRRTVLVGTVP